MNSRFTTQAKLQLETRILAVNEATGHRRVASVPMIPARVSCTTIKDSKRISQAVSRISRRDPRMGRFNILHE